MASSRSAKLLDTFIVSLQQLGVEKTIELLTTGLQKNDHTENPHRRFILQLVSAKFELSEKDILFSNDRKTDRYIAVCFCVYYLRYQFNYEMEEIPGMLNKQIWVCYKASERIKSLNPAHNSDRKFYSWKQEFDKAVEKFKSKSTHKKTS